MRVEIAFATPSEQVILGVEIAAGATVADAIQASGILTQFPQIDMTRVAVGIYGERVALTDPIEEGDRVEIYRPLTADPKEARRARARRRQT